MEQEPQIYGPHQTSIEDKSLIEAIDLRHPIIEANQKNGIYIPNDVYLGEVTETNTLILC